MDLEHLRASITSLLDEAATLNTEGKTDEAKAKLDEARRSRGQLETAKAIVRETEATQVADLQQQVADLKKKADEPVRLPFAEPEPIPDVKGMPNVLALRYGEPEAVVKAVIKDLYGAEDYNQKRDAQMRNFFKYVRFGETALEPKELATIRPLGTNILLQPEMVKSEVAAGRSVREIKATLEEGSNELGGYLVPEDYRQQIITRLVGLTIVRGRARTITTTRDAVEWPRLEGGNSQYTSAVRVTWVDETPANASAAETNPTWGMVRIPVHTVMARTNLSRNLLEDAAFPLADVMSGLFAEAMAIDEDAQFITGQGNGRPLGVLGARASGTNASPVEGVAAVVTGDSTAITAAGLVNLVYQLDSQYRGGAVLSMAKNTQRDIRQLKDGDGRFMWQPGLQAGQPASLLGYAVAESESVPSVGANNHPIIFGNWASGYVIVDRVGMTVERVVDVTTTGQNQVALFARRRFGGSVVSPWAFCAQKVST